MSSQYHHISLIIDLLILVLILGPIVCLIMWPGQTIFVLSGTALFIYVGANNWDDGMP